MSETLLEALRNASHVSSRGFTFLDGALNPREWTFARVAAEADRRARYFLSLGLRKGDRLGMVVPDGEDFVLSFYGAMRAGIVPVPMYPPLALGKIDGYVESAGRILATAGARMLLTSKEVAPILWSLTSTVAGLEDLVLTEKVRDHDDAQVKASLDGLVVAPSDPCFLQFTSGSTSDPKGVVVTHANLVANSRAIMFDGLASDGERDRGVSWLPLYHDMGLIGFVIAPVFNLVPVVFIPTLSFVKRPQVWMETIHRYRGTITFAPNFAFGLAAKRMTPEKLAALDLSCLRVLGCGAEPIHAGTMRGFVETFAAAGFRPEALMPCYGMAEATLAISFDRLDRPMTAIAIDRDAYEGERVARPAGASSRATLDLVSVGDTFGGHRVEIMSDDGRVLGEGEVGEIVFSGPSVTAGYFGNAEATRALLAGGWLRSGDLGFKLGGQLYVSGRKKDLIILNGRNYYPQAIEWEVEQVEGIRKGNAVAFSVPGANSEELVIAAETKAEDRAALAEAVRRHVQTVLGLAAREVVLVDAGALPKTSSGKLQRRRTRQLYEAGELGRTGNRTLGSTATKVAIARHVTRSAIARLQHTIKQPARKLASAVFRADGR
jgi:fatty-acyl-CoA synthase